MTTQMVDKSNFDNKQYKADLQCAYDSGYVKGQIDILEKLKAEFEEDKYILLNQITAIKVIDKHIEKTERRINDRRNSKKGEQLQKTDK